MTIEQKIDSIMSECGFFSHENKFISLEVLRDAYLLLKESDMDACQTSTQASNLYNASHQRHIERVKKYHEAHIARLTQ